MTSAIRAFSTLFHFPAAVLCSSASRSSTLVIHDPAEAREVGRIELAGRLGSPMLKLVGSELWTIDYDTFVRVDLRSRQLINSLQIQPPLPGTPA